MDNTYANIFAENHPKKSSHLGAISSIFPEKMSDQENVIILQGTEDTRNGICTLPNTDFICEKHDVLNPAWPP